MKNVQITYKIFSSLLKKLLSVKRVLDADLSDFEDLFSHSMFAIIIPDELSNTKLSPQKFENVLNSINSNMFLLSIDSLESSEDANNEILSIIKNYKNEDIYINDTSGEFDYDYFLNRIAATLKIPRDYFPCIIVTTNFLVPTFRIIKTSENVIEEQLVKLGYFSKKIPSINKTLKLDQLEFLEALSKENIDFIQNEYIEYTNSFFLHKFTNLLERKAKAEYILGADNYQTSLLDELKKFSNSENLDRVRRRLTLIKDKNLIEVKYNQFMEDSVVAEILSIAMLIKKEELSYIEKEICSLLSDEGLIFFKTGLKIRNFLKSIDDEKFDYSALIIPFAKTFENEINQSINQLMRKKFGVEMPKYYYKKSPEENIRLEINGFTIKISHPKYPGMGQSRIAFDAHKESILSYSKTLKNAKIETLKSFEDKWKELTHIRNDSAHHQILEHEKFISVYSIFMNLFEDKVFHLLNEIRAELKN